MRIQEVKKKLEEIEKLSEEIKHVVNLPFDNDSYHNIEDNAIKINTISEDLLMKMDKFYPIHENGLVESFFYLQNRVCVIKRMTMIEKVMFSDKEIKYKYFTYRCCYIQTNLNTIFNELDYLEFADEEVTFLGELEGISDLTLKGCFIGFDLAHNLYVKTSFQKAKEKLVKFGNAVIEYENEYMKIEGK